MYPLGVCDMKKRFLRSILAYGFLSALLAGCGDANEKESSLDRTPQELTSSLLEKYRNGVLSFEANRKTTYSTKVGDTSITEEGIVKTLLGKESYHFYEETQKALGEDYHDVITDTTYWKESDGQAVQYEIDWRNQVNRITPIGGSFEFEDRFYNPFSKVSFGDFSSNDTFAYSIKDEAKLASFFAPIGFYNEDVLSFSFVVLKDESLSITCMVEDQDGEYVASMSGTLKVVESKEELPIPTPYKTESYHKDLQSAYDTMTKAKNFTLTRIRSAEGRDDIEEEKSVSRISTTSPKAVAIKENGVTKGVATFGDGSDYKYTIKDGKVVKGDPDSVKLPFFLSVLKAEVFEKIDDTHFKARTPELAKEIAGTLVEKTEEGMLVEGVGYTGLSCDELILETDGGTKLKGYTYYVYRSDENGATYREKDEVSISKVNSTSINYDFSEGTKESSSFDFASYAGTYYGYNFADCEGIDNVLHQLAIKSIDDITLDGEKVTVKESKDANTFSLNWKDRVLEGTLGGVYGDYLTLRDSEYVTNKFYLHMDKKASSVPGLKDIVGKWTFNSYDDENDYSLTISNPLSIELEIDESRLGETKIVTVETKNAKYDEATGKLTFDYADGTDSYTYTFFSKNFACVSNKTGTNKELARPDSD